MINYPNIDPVAISIPIPGFWGDALNIHWYGLAYVIGAYLIYLRMVATRDNFEIKASKEEVSDVVFTYCSLEQLLVVDLEVYCSMICTFSFKTPSIS